MVPVKPSHGVVSRIYWHSGYSPTTVEGLMSLTRQILTCSAIAVSMGCYKYVPATLETTPVGSKIRALLSTEGQAALSRRLNIDTREVTGELLESRGDTVLMTVRSERRDDDLGSGALYQVVDIPTSHLLRIDLRQADMASTVGLVALAAGTAAVLIIGATSGGGPGQVLPPDNGPDERRTNGWIFRIPLPIFRE